VHCRGCGLSVVWLRGEHGQGMTLVDSNGEAIRLARAGLPFRASNDLLRVHLGTCKDADRWRLRPPRRRKGT